MNAVVSTLRCIKTAHFLLLALFLASCTTIEIREADIFDNHTTVTPQSFEHEHLSISERVLATGDDERIHAWFFERDDARATLLYMGGNGFLMVKSGLLVSTLQYLPVNFVLFDYRGYGQSSGSPTISGLKTDVDTVLEEIRLDEAFAKLPLIMHGHSMGSFLASEAALTHGADALVLESPISNPKSWSRGVVPWFLRPFIRLSFEEQIANEDNIANVKQWDAPLLIMNGTEDNITPMFMSEELYEAASTQTRELLKIQGGNHNDLPGFEEYREAYLWLIEALGSQV